LEPQEVGRKTETFSLVGQEVDPTLSPSISIGTGAIIVFNQSVDTWQILESLAHHFLHETCGQCTLYRLGSKEIYSVLEGIIQGKGALADIQKLIEIGQMMVDTCKCSLGQTAANPIRTFLQNIQIIPLGRY
jgi:NADH-quinone oxidoreductase subunit F